MITDNYIRKGKVVNVVDGDTVDVDIDMGFYSTMRQRFRLLRINTPEIYGEEKPQGLVAKAFTQNALLGKEVVFQTTKTDSFKRWLAEIWYVDEAGNQLNISDVLLNNRLAEPYNG